MVERCKIYQNKGSQGSLEAGHLTKTFAQVAGVCQILKIYPRVAGGDGKHLELADTILYLINFLSMSTVSLKLRLKQFSFPTLNFYYKNASKGNTFCIIRSFSMVLISYDLISFHHACALFIQCLYIQQ